MTDLVTPYTNVYGQTVDAEQYAKSKLVLLKLFKDESYDIGEKSSFEIIKYLPIELESDTMFNKTIEYDAETFKELKKTSRDSYSLLDYMLSCGSDYFNLITAITNKPDGKAQFFDFKFVDNKSVIEPIRVQLDMISSGIKKRENLNDNTGTDKKLHNFTLDFNYSRQENDMQRHMFLLLVKISLMCYVVANKCSVAKKLYGPSAHKNSKSYMTQFAFYKSGANPTVTFMESPIARANIVFDEDSKETKFGIFDPNTKFYNNGDPIRSYDAKTKKAFSKPRPVNLKSTDFTSSITNCSEVSVVIKLKSLTITKSGIWSHKAEATECAYTTCMANVGADRFAKPITSDEYMAAEEESKHHAFAPRLESLTGNMVTQLNLFNDDTQSVANTDAD
jgi:hypothetical protein